MGEGGGEVAGTAGKTTQAGSGCRGEEGKGGSWRRKRGQRWFTQQESALKRSLREKRAVLRVQRWWLQSPGRGGRRVQIHDDLRLRCRKVKVFLLVLVFPLQERPSLAVREGRLRTVWGHPWQ